MSIPAALRLVIQGRVQGVGYRAWLAERARALGLAGWVRNRTDGTVEAVLAGPETAVRACLAACRQGPPAARVAAVETSPCPPPLEREFFIK